MRRILRWGCRFMLRLRRIGARILRAMRLVILYFRVMSLMAWDKLRRLPILVVDVEVPGFVPQVLPILQSLRETQFPVAIYIARFPQNHPAFDKLGIPHARHFDEALSRFCYFTDLFLSTSIQGRGPSKSSRAFMAHNKPIKYTMFPRRDFAHYPIHLLNCPLHREQTELTITKYGLQKSDFQLYEIGYPKSDALLQGAYTREELLNRVGLDPASPTVLYAPSWDDGLSLRSCGEAVVAVLASIPNINLIIKLHPISYLRPGDRAFSYYTGGVDWIEKLAPYTALSNVCHLHEYLEDIDPLLAAADVLVTDVSSVSLEFLMLDRPVVFLDCPAFFNHVLLDEYRQSGYTIENSVIDNPATNGGRHVGLVVSELSELPGAVTHCLHHKDELACKRKIFIRQIAYNPGYASNVAAETIILLLSQHCKVDNASIIL